MYITCFSFKGGVGKTTTAVHLAGCLQEIEPGSVILVDGDLNRSSVKWSEPGELPFPVVHIEQAAKDTRGFKYVITDTAARPEPKQIKILADGCDLLILPTSPAPMPIHTLMSSREALDTIGAHQYKVLLTMVPPHPNKDGERARTSLEKRGFQLFGNSIRYSTAFYRAPGFGCLVKDVESGRSKDHWMDYMSVTREILG